MKNNPFRYFKTSPGVIRLAVMLYVRFPLSLRQVDDILFECGIDICHETIRPDVCWRDQETVTLGRLLIALWLVIASLGLIGSLAGVVSAWIEDETPDTEPVSNQGEK